MNNIAILPQRLHAHDRERLEAHFLALDGEDRRLRFGSSLGDTALKEYAARIDFDRDEVFAVADDELVLIGAVHVAFTDHFAELGLSVLPGFRGRGVGSALFERAVVHLRNRGTRTVFVHCLVENQAMMHLARKHGMRLVFEGIESEARLELRPATAETLLTEWVQDQGADAVNALRGLRRALQE